jgi:hypothetical protein
MIAMEPLRNFRTYQSASKTWLAKSSSNTREPKISASGTEPTELGNWGRTKGTELGNWGRTKTGELGSDQGRTQPTKRGNWGRTKVERSQLRHEHKNKAVFRPYNALIYRRKDAFRGKGSPGASPVVSFLLTPPFWCQKHHFKP